MSRFDKAVLLGQDLGLRALSGLCGILVWTGLGVAEPAQAWKKRIDDKIRNLPP